MQSRQGQAKGNQSMHARAVKALLDTRTRQLRFAVLLRTAPEADGRRPRCHTQSVHRNDTQAQERGQSSQEQKVQASSKKLKKWAKAGCQGAKCSRWRPFRHSVPKRLVEPHRKEMMSSTQHFSMSSKPLLASIANESLFSSPPIFSLQDQADQQSLRLKTLSVT